MGKQVFLDFHFWIVQQACESCWLTTDACGNHLVADKGGGWEMNTFSQPRSLFKWAAVKKKKIPVRNHWCVTFCASLPSYTATAFSLCSCLVLHPCCFPASYILLLLYLLKQQHLPRFPLRAFLCLFLAGMFLGSSGQTEPCPYVITASQTEEEETGGRNVGS